MYFCQDHYCQRWLTISILFGLAVWFCSGQGLPAHPCSLAWIRAGRAAITPQGKQNRTNINPSHEHLTLNVEHITILYNNLFTTHTYYIYIYIYVFFFLQICTCQTCTHMIVCIALCFCYFVHCLFVYLYIVLLLSVSCPVAVILLHCGASVTITNSSYV